MKTKTLYKLIVLISLVFFSGCSKDFLDTEPEGAITEDEFYKTDEDATRAIMACYNMLQSWYSTPWTTLWMLKTFAADEIYSAGSMLGDQAAADEINQFTYGANNDIIKEVYSIAYYVILRANKIIDQLPSDNDYKKAVIAEAKTIRAYTYFELTTLWGTVPLVTHELTAGNYEQPNSTLSALWAQIGQDLKDAITDLPLKSKMSDLDMDASRVSKGTAQALLGKAYLYQEKYDSAIIQFNTVIESNEYSLLSDYTQILRESSEFGTESLFEISFSSDMNNTWSTPNIWAVPVRTAMDNRIIELCGPRGDAGFSGGNSGLIGGWGFAYPMLSIYNAYVEANDTVRLRGDIMNEARLISLGGTYKASDGNYPWGCTGLVRLKYGTWADETVDASVGQPELNYGTNTRVIRYADVLLMIAEAYNQSGDDANARIMLNKVRSRVKESDISAESGNDLFKIIKAERQRELSFEGSRFQDLIRWGDAATVLADQCKQIPTGKLVNDVLQYMTISGAGFKSYNVLFPFPADEITSNSLLQQNTGY
jgi:starch-binding outer membrane protein, SusD/RagB family